MAESPADPSPVKNTWLRRSLTLAAIKILKRIRPRQSSVLFLTRRICVKYGSFEHVSQAHAMQFLASQTSIPVPKIYCAFTRKGMTYIVMSRLDGLPIGCNWSTRPDHSKARLLAQLREYIQEMRNLNPPSGAVEGVNGSKLYDIRVPGGLHGLGPFNSIRDFHSFITSGITVSSGQISEVNKLLMSYEESQYRTCFTHGDLNCANILVNGDNVVGIVDWDTCGWYPEYWEYTTAWNVHPYNEFWREEVDKFLQEYPEALEMESIRREYFGDF